LHAVNDDSVFVGSAKRFTALRERIHGQGEGRGGGLAFQGLVPAIAGGGVSIEAMGREETKASSFSFPSPDEKNRWKLREGERNSNSTIA